MQLVATLEQRQASSASTIAAAASKLPQSTTTAASSSRRSHTSAGGQAMHGAAPWYRATRLVTDVRFRRVSHRAEACRMAHNRLTDATHHDGERTTSGATSVRLQRVHDQAHLASPTGAGTAQSERRTQ